jgi:hypothetical protein
MDKVKKNTFTDITHRRQNPSDFINNNIIMTESKLRIFLLRNFFDPSGPNILSAVSNHR